MVIGSADRDRLDLDQTLRSEQTGNLDQSTCWQVVPVEELIPNRSESGQLAHVGYERGQLDEVVGVGARGLERRQEVPKGLGRLGGKVADPDQSAGGVHGDLTGNEDEITGRHGDDLAVARK